MASRWGEGTARAADALLRAAGRSVVVRVRQMSDGGGAMPRMEVVLKPCVLRRSGASAEMLAGAQAVAKAGEAAELFAVSTRVAAGDVVWRVVSYAPVMCRDAVVCWRVELAR